MYSVTDTYSAVVAMYSVTDTYSAAVAMYSVTDSGYKGNHYSVTDSWLAVCKTPKIQLR
jgi:hypothetical protein